MWMEMATQTTSGGTLIIPPIGKPEQCGGLQFHTYPESLANRSNDTTPVGLNNLPRSLGNPQLRFGSSINRIQSGSIAGPREYLNETAKTGFIGRYTVQETSDTNFLYPGAISNDPFNSGSGGPTLSFNSENLVNPYANENNRRGEDLVLSNVHEFDIQVWDDGLSTPRFVNLGNASGSGWYHIGASQNSIFGNRYDTWHPSPNMPNFPPYVPFMGTRDATFNGLGSDGEVWLKAIRIHIRFYDEGSEQMRDLTFSFRLNRNNSRD